jgi:hypothetical protein
MHAADALRVAWYRFRSTLRCRWTGYLAIALLIGLVGGLAMGSVAAARRTQGGYAAYLAATNPSDLTVLSGISASPGAPGYDPAVIEQIAALPGVRHVASYALLNVAILGLDGQPVAAPYIAGPLPGSLDGEYFSTDRMTAVQGRLPDPSRPDEIAIDAKGTPGSVHVGTVAELGFYTNAQLQELYAGKHVTPVRRQQVTVTRAVRAAQSLGLPVPAAEGIRLAFGTGRDRDQVTAGPAVLGTVLASVVMMATITFGSSLAALVSHPALYGWNWTFYLSSGGTAGTVSGAAPVLDSDPAVAAWAGIWYATATIDGQEVPVIGMTPNAPVAPPLLSGHGLAAPDEVVLGAATLAALHRQVDDWVTVTDGGSGPFRLRIAGTATLPSLGVGQTAHTEMGTGAVLDYQHIPGDTAAKPNEVLVTLRPGADAAAAQARLGQRLVPAPNGGVVAGVQRPAEITDYRSMGIAPLILAGTLAAGAVASLWLTLAASVRRRRADLALLKTLGFTRRQLAVTVAWQSTITVAAGALIGVPLGIALGRYLWDLFARQISVVPEPSVPVLTVLLVVIGALAAANLVAAVPGRSAARVPAAALLRAE